MEARFEDEHEEDSQTSPPHSPISGDEPFPPSPKKSRQRGQKRVVTVPINGGDGLFRRKGEVYPPPDNWSWRKYGQKPIKGSPYPRGYYKCSRSKGCPARKQVERSRLDPTTLLITYSCDHNHPPPHRTTRTHTPSPPPPPTPSSPSSGTEAITHQSDHEHEGLCTSTLEPEFVELAGELGWLCGLIDGGLGIGIGNGIETLVGPMPDHVDVDFKATFEEEDQRLFGDLGDLPDSSLVFRWCGLRTPCCGATG